MAGRKGGKRGMGRFRSAVKKAGGGCVLFQCQKEAPVVINERKKVTVKELKQLRKREKICILM